MRNISSLSFVYNVPANTYSCLTWRISVRLAMRPSPPCNPTHFLYCILPNPQNKSLLLVFQLSPNLPYTSPRINTEESMGTKWPDYGQLCIRPGPTSTRLLTNVDRETMARPPKSREFGGRMGYNGVLCYGCIGA